MSFKHNPVPIENGLFHCCHVNWTPTSLDAHVQNLPVGFTTALPISANVFIRDESDPWYRQRMLEHKAGRPIDKPEATPLYDASKRMMYEQGVPGRINGCGTAGVIKPGMATMAAGVGSDPLD